MKKTILLVDDEEAILTSIGWALEQNDFRVTTASDGQKAIDRLRAGRYDLMITDLLMPVVDGLGVLKQAKRLHPDIGVIILTGHGDIGSAVHSLQLGADDYLLKPCDMDDLLSKARRSFERQDLVARLRVRNERLKGEIAARKVVEKKLQQSQSGLERQVTERTATARPRSDGVSLTYPPGPLCSLLGRCRLGRNLGVCGTGLAGRIEALGHRRGTAVCRLGGEDGYRGFFHPL